MNLIEHIIEPNRLLLVWQGPEGGDRTRRAVAELCRIDDTFELKYLVDSDDFRLAKECGFEGYPAFFKTDRSYKDGVIETFLKRLPPRNRPDINSYLSNLRIPVDAEISDFALLGYSGAKLPGDWFAIVHPFDNAPSPCELLVEVAGFRYYKGKDTQINIGDTVTLEPESDNQYDPKAIKVMLNSSRIGYIGRGQLDAFHLWLSNNQISAVIEKKNGQPERPSVMLFVAVS